MEKFPLKGLISIISVETLVLAFQSSQIRNRIDDIKDTSIIFDIFLFFVSIGSVFYISNLKNIGRKTFILKISLLMVISI